jgi:hypothetical protein
MDSQCQGVGQIAGEREPYFAPSDLERGVSDGVIAQKSRSLTSCAQCDGILFDDVVSAFKT